MSIWHVYPTYIRLVDGSHIPLVLMFQTDTRELVGGTVADTHEKVSSWIRDLTAAHGVPEEVIHAVFAEHEPADMHQNEGQDDPQGLRQSPGTESFRRFGPEHPQDQQRAVPRAPQHKIPSGAVP